MTPVELVLSKLPNARPNGHGWQACCPAHDDRQPSLSISEGEDGRALLRCHAGCTTSAVVTAIGLRMADLMPAQVPTSVHRPVNKAPDRPANGNNGRRTPTVYPSPEAAAEAFANWKGGTVETIYKWTDKWHRARIRLAEGKTFVEITRNDTGWIQKGPNKPHVLYRQSDLPENGPVAVCEGEKACDAAWSIELPAVTSGGSTSAAGGDWSALAGREVWILPDNDEAGRKYANAVADILVTLNPPVTARIVELPELPVGGDFVEYLQTRNDIMPDIIRQEVQALADQTDPEKPEAQAPGILPFVSFPVDTLPQPVRSFVSKAARALGCDASFVALPLLAGLASAIGNTRRIQLRHSWTEPAIIWAVIVGDSGTMKSPALEQALRPIRKRQRDAMKCHVQDMESYSLDLTHYDRALTEWKRGKDETDPPIRPAEPVPDRYYCDDVTIEALAMLLVNQPRGLLLVRDELAGWFGTFDRYVQGKGGGDSAKWLELFGGRPMMVDRKSGTPQTICIPQATVSIAGGIQPETLRRALGTQHKENGLAARLLLTCPPREPKRWNDADIDAAAEAAIQNVFERLYELQPDVDNEGEPQPRIVTMTPTGKEVWIEFYNVHAAESAELTGELSAVWSKLEGYAARLALLVHFIRWAANDPTLQSPDAVDETSIAAGVKLSRWFGYEARRVYAILAESDDERDLRRLVELIGRKGGTITVRQLQQSSRQYRSAADAENALAELVKKGLGRWEDRKPSVKGGRPTRAFRLNSTATCLRNLGEYEENRGFVDVDNADILKDDANEGREQGEL